MGEAQIVVIVVGWQGISGATAMIFRRPSKREMREDLLEAAAFRNSSVRYFAVGTGIQMLQLRN